VVLVELPAAINSFVAGIPDPDPQGQSEPMSPNPASSPLATILRPTLSSSSADAIRLSGEAIYPKSLLTLRLGSSSDLASKVFLVKGGFVCKISSYLNIRLGHNTETLWCGGTGGLAKADPAKSTMNVIAAKKAPAFENVILSPSCIGSTGLVFLANLVSYKRILDATCVNHLISVEILDSSPINGEANYIYWKGFCQAKSRFS